VNADGGFSRKDGDEGHWALGRGHVAESGSEDVRPGCGRTVRMRGGPGLRMMELPLKTVERPSVVQRRKTIAAGLPALSSVRTHTQPYEHTYANPTPMSTDHLFSQHFSFTTFFTKL